MASTYTPIATVAITAGDTGITFNSIPQTYTDLMIVLNIYNSSVNTGTGLWFRVNGDSSALYSNTEIFGSGSGSGTSNRSSNNTIWAGSTSLAVGYPSNYIFNINNYSNTSTFKSAFWQISQTGSNQLSLNAGLYRSTSAITQFTVLVPGGNSQLFAGNATVYGIKAA